MGIKEYKNSVTGVVSRKENNNCISFGVVANVLPASCPTSAYPKEMMKSFATPSHCPRTDGDEVPVRAWTRYCFNFALAEDWKSQPDTPNFSFTAQFPKVTAWLTHPCSTSYWLSLERGVLSAIKGKNNPRAAPNVVFKTLKHATLHAMFTEMEELLVLPKSWKIKK